MFHLIGSNDYRPVGSQRIHLLGMMNQGTMGEVGCLDSFVFHFLCRKIMTKMYKICPKNT